MTAVICSALIVFGLLAFPRAVYSSLPGLPELYIMPESSGIYLYPVVLAAQILIGGLFPGLMSRTSGKHADYALTRECTAEAVVISSAVLSLIGLIVSKGEYALIDTILGIAASVLIYVLVMRELFKTTKQKAAILSVAAYVINYALAVAVLLFLIILLGLNT